VRENWTGEGEERGSRSGGDKKERDVWWTAKSFSLSLQYSITFRSKPWFRNKMWILIEENSACGSACGMPSRVCWDILAKYEYKHEVKKRERENCNLPLRF
jgi:hypothetical protein